MLYKQNLLLGALLIVCAEFMFSIMGATIKHAHTLTHNEVIVFARNAIGLLVLCGILASKRDKVSLKTSVFHVHLLRSAFGLSAMYCFFYALGNLPLAEGMLMKMTAPIFVPIVALLWLNERTPWYVLLAIPVGFLGVWVVLGEPGGSLSYPAWVGVMGGALAAVAKVCVRKLGHTEPVVRTVFYFSAISTVISAGPMLWFWVQPHPQVIQFLLLLGIAGTIGQLLMTQAYSLAPASKVGVFTYASVVFAAVLGFIIWNESLERHFYMGSALIVVAGLTTLIKKQTKTHT